jgi:hypothetical protein
MPKVRKIIDRFRNLALLIVLITMMSLMVYGAAQQIMRQSANDPQVEMVENVSTLLEHGDSPDSIGLTEKSDLNNSLMPFIMIADENGNQVASTASLDGNKLKIPQGVFTFTKAHGDDRVTWQPKPGVRQALVMRYYKSGNNSGFVAAGRSLREIEARTKNLGTLLFFGWLTTLGVITIVYILLEPKKTKSS